MSSNMTPFTDLEANGSKMRSSSSKPQKEKHLIAAVVILTIVLIAFVIAVIVLAIKDKKYSAREICKTTGCLKSAIELLDSLNTSVDPCDDFYQFSCGKWASTFKGIGSSKMQAAAVQLMFETSDNIIQATADPNMPESVKKIANSYLTCSKYGELREADKVWLLQLLQKVGGWPMIDKDWEEDEYDWEPSLAKAIRDLFITTPIMVSVDINYFNTNSRIIRIQQPLVEDSVPLEKERILSIARKIGDRGNDPSLEKEYEEVEKLAEQLRKMSLFDHELMDKPKERMEITIEELDEKIPWINWMEFISTIFGSYLTTTLYRSNSVIIQGVSYLEKFGELRFGGNITKRTLANYIAASFMQSIFSVHQTLGSTSSLVSTPYLDKTLAPAGFSYLCLNFYSKYAHNAIDYISYKKRNTKLMDNKMMDYILGGMKDIINNADWLDEKTRLAALDKLAVINYFTGFPYFSKDGRMIDEYFSGLPNITENSLRNQLNIRAHVFKRHAELLRKPIDRNIWPMYPGLQASQTNAVNMVDENLVVIPAGIQVAPMFHAERPNYWNFGSLGYILGHEVCHSFDSSGSKRDKYGNVKNWWMEEAKKEFKKQSDCFNKFYSTFSFGYKDYHVNGSQTLAENIADNGGIHQAYLAYMQWEKDHGKEKRLPGLEDYNTHQLFYIAASQPFCGIHQPPEVVYAASLTDTHTPTMFRFNGALANSKDFAKVFNCKSGSRMNPVNKCVIW